MDHFASEHMTQNSVLINIYSKNYKEFYRNILTNRLACAKISASTNERYITMRSVVANFAYYYSYFTFIKMK